jgi:site-specific recombinase XerD
MEGCSAPLLHAWLSTFSFESLVIYQDLNALADVAIAHPAAVESSGSKHLIDRSSGNASKRRQRDDLVFATRKGGPLGRRNLLRHIKAAAAQLGLSKAVDFRSFRTMHSSLMLREGARPEVVRDNMGHANIDVTQNVYGKSWWEERVDAVKRFSFPL